MEQIQRITLLLGQPILLGVLAQLKTAVQGRLSSDSMKLTP
jgi:hypothetical protein